MKTTPLKYRLNVIGGGLIIFVAVRTYLPAIAASAGLNKNFNIWLLVYAATLSLSCFAPIAFIENMCSFHPSLFRGRKLQASHGILVIHSMLLVVLLAMVNSIVMMGLGKLGIVFPVQQLEPVDNALTLILYFAYTTAVPAVFEELFIRGIVLNLLLPNGRKFAVIASSLIFTVMHTQIQSFIPVFGAGIILACIYLYTDNIFAVMALHFVNNAYSFVMMYMQQNVNDVSYMAFASFVLSIILVGGVCATAWLKKNGTDLFRPLKDKGRNSPLSRLMNSPVMVLGLLACLMAVFSQMYTDLTM